MYQNAFGAPYEIFTGPKASITHLKHFSCAAQAMVLMRFRQSKLADTFPLCCFIGCDEPKQAYRVYNPHNDTVVVSS